MTKNIRTYRVCSLVKPLRESRLLAVIDFIMFLIYSVASLKRDLPPVIYDSHGVSVTVESEKMVLITTMQKTPEGNSGIGIE